MLFNERFSTWLEENEKNLKNRDFLLVLDRIKYKIKSEETIFSQVEKETIEIICESMYDLQIMFQDNIDKFNSLKKILRQ